MRSLQQHTLPSVSDPPSPPPSVDSDIVVILAALLCALICIVGLTLVARCAWFHRSPHSSPYSPPSKGIKKKVLDTLPKLSFHKNLNISADCPICLAEFVGGDEIRILPQCGHRFHVGCVDTWLGSRSSCPLCRRVLLAAKVGEVQKEEENRCRNSCGAEEEERRRDGNQCECVIHTW